MLCLNSAQSEIVHVCGVGFAEPPAALIVHHEFILIYREVAEFLKPACLSGCCACEFCSFALSVYCWLHALHSVVWLLDFIWSSFLA
jgi:hypothetical protein